MPRKKRDISQGLLEAIEKKLNIRRSALNQRIQVIKKKYNAPLMDDEVAICLIASNGAVNINPKEKKYFDSNKGYAVPQKAIEEAYRIQTTVSIPPVKLQLPTTAKDLELSKHEERRSPDIRISPDPILSQEKIDEAIKMATKAYPYIYVIENSMREFIILSMVKEYGEDWWNEPDVVPVDVKEDVERYKNREQQKPWAGKKSDDVHEIYYTLLPHLAKIITCNKNWKTLFSKVFKTQTFINALIDSTYTLRNNVMHCNPITDYDIKKIKDNLLEWQRILREAYVIISKLKKI